MKKYIFYCFCLISLSSTVCKAQQNKWIILFDGNSTDRLRGYSIPGFPDKAWKVQDSALVAQTGVPNIDLVTKDEYRDFELEFEWAVSPAGNSGVFYHVKESLSHESGNGNSPNWLDNFEMQILDDIHFNDTAAIRSAGSLYDLIPPQHKQLKPIGEYNQARLIVKGNHVEHWLNGIKVVEYENGSPEMIKMLSVSKFKNNPGYGKSTNGLVMFQHHGQKVWLRKIRIRVL
jgi:sorbitol-specific phosphotransferase system component IIA